MYGLGEEEYLRIPYAFGDAPKFAKILPRTEFKRLQEALERTRRARVGQAFTLVVVVTRLGPILTESVQYLTFH